MSAEYDAACEIRDAINELTNSLGRAPLPLDRFRDEGTKVRITVEGGAQWLGHIEDFGAEFGGWISLRKSGSRKPLLIPWHRIVLIEDEEA